jgi:predicted phage terminase large subunit-like protein
VETLKVESNAGGRAFSLMLKKKTKETGNHFTRFIDFTQRLNKEARILSNSTDVVLRFYFPENWRQMFPEFERDMREYQRQGKNLHDDAPDCCTMIVEDIKKDIQIVFF